MPIDPEKILETTKKSQVEFFKNEIPITNDGNKRYTCANPEGPVDNNGCPADDPYCRCPEEIKFLRPKDAFLIEPGTPQTQIPEELTDTAREFAESVSSSLNSRSYKVIDSNNIELGDFNSREEAQEFIDGLDPSQEPTDAILEFLLEQSKYCTLIEEELGEEYLGCDWEDPDSPTSCSCPTVGEKYKEWRKHYETYSTFWNTPKQTPLLRNAQMTLLTAQKAEAIVHGDFSIRPGAIINIEVSKINDSTDLTSSSGRWMVAEIEHMLEGANAHTMTLQLIRDSLYVDPNSSQSVES
tara:strand:+ start:13014 stop:13904 length:891 start_codon:yes stop_codon:yes gene_type:complete